MVKHQIVMGLCCSLALVVCGCSRQQSDWQKTRETNTADAYEQFLKKYPTGEFTAQAEARAKDLYAERDWLKARDADTPEAYQAFMKQYPEGKWTEEARIRVENFTLAQAPGAAASARESSTNGTEVSPAGAPVTAAPALAPITAAPAAAKATQATGGSGPASPASDSSREPPARPSSGAYAVQLGAFKSGSGAAKERWTHLQRQYPTLMAGLSSKVLSRKTTDGSLYRLQATGLSEKRARDVCAALKAKSQPCMVVPPADG